MSEPAPVGDYFAAAMSQADGCPAQGCINVEPPDAATPHPLGWRLHYRCSACATTWTNDWNQEGH